MNVNNIVKRLIQLKSTGVNLDLALDIGAYRGEFTNIIKSVWPKITVKQFEADERQKDYLLDTAEIVLLGDRDQQVDFYTIPDTGWGSTTGSSIYRENTDFYNNARKQSRLMTTLDSVVDHSLDWHNSLIKIDTQGSELLILDGASELLSQRPRFILLECSIQEYNEGAPLINESLDYMLNKGYKLYDIVDTAYSQTGELLQLDIMFMIDKR